MYGVNKTMKINVLTLCDPVRVLIFGLGVPLGAPSFHETFSRVRADDDDDDEMKAKALLKMSAMF